MGVFHNAHLTFSQTEFVLCVFLCCSHRLDSLLLFQLLFLGMLQLLLLLFFRPVPTKLDSRKTTVSL